MVYIDQFDNVCYNKRIMPQPSHEQGQPFSYDSGPAVDTDINDAIMANQDPYFVNIERQRFNVLRNPFTTKTEAVRLGGDPPYRGSAVLVLYPAATGDEKFMRSELAFLQKGLTNRRQVLGVPYDVHNSERELFEKNDVRLTMNC